MRKFKCKKELIMNEQVMFSEGITYIGEDIGGNWIRFNNEIGAPHEYNVNQTDFTDRFEEVAEIKAPAHYDNSKGSLYKVASERNWNPYLFDVVKRLERGGKKDPLRQEIEKSIFVLQLWLKEHVDDK